MTTHQSPNTSKNLIIITGACGFIGSHLAQHYLGKGFHVVGVDNFSTAFRQNLDFLRALPEAHGHFTFVEADVSAPWTWFEALDDKMKRNLALVFHFASPASPPLYQKLALETLWVNTLGLKNCIQAADSFQARVVFASTSEIYGDPLVHPQPESYWGNVNTIGPRSCYDESKRLGETLISTSNTVHHTRHGFVRIFNTYGPRMNPHDGRVVINFLTQAMNSEDLTIYGDGLQTRSFCYIDDLVEGITRYAAQPALCEPVNLGNPVELTIRELAQTVQKLFPKAKIAAKATPLPINDPLKRKPVILKAHDLLKWTPKVSLEEGLQKMAAWLKNEI